MKVELIAITFALFNINTWLLIIAYHIIKILNLSQNT